MRETYQARLDVATPEGVSFTLPLAGPTQRALAWLVDLLVIATALLLLSLAGSALLGPLTFGLYNALLIFVVLLVLFGYHLALEWFMRGQTLGKRLLGIRVVDAAGLQLTFPQVALRNLMRSVDFLPACYGVGVAAV